MLRDEIRCSAFARFGTKRGRLLRRLPFSSFPKKAGCFCQPRRRPQGFHAENCVCLMLRCCAFIAHRAPSQKGIARTRGRKSWQLTVAYNGFPALEPLRLPAAWQGINSCFFRHARCRRNIGNIGTPLHLWFRIITQSEIFLNHMYWNQRQKLCN